MEQEQGNQEMAGNGVPGEHHSSRSIIMVAVIAVVVIVLVLMYIWGSSLTLQKTSENTASVPPVPTVDEQVDALQEVSTSTELEAIEADIQNTGLENLDEDLDEIEAGLRSDAQ